MKNIFVYISIVVLGIAGCRNPSTILLNINPDYHGWVYLIPVHSKMTYSFKIDSTTLGIVYISDSLYGKENLINLMIKIDDKFVPSSKIRTYNISFYPRNSKYKISYKKFYFPLTNQEIPDKIDKVYTYKKNDYNIFYLGEFEYYYTTGIIDRSIVITHN